MIQTIGEVQLPISAFIIVTNDYMSSNSTYANPRLISLVNTREGAIMKQYAIQMRTDVHVTVEHTFVERCAVLTRIVASYSAWSIIWVLIGGV
jgi:hypothetical protein